MNLKVPHQEYSGGPAVPRKMACGVGLGAGQHSCAHGPGGPRCPRAEAQERPERVPAEARHPGSQGRTPLPGQCENKNKFK